MAVHQAVDALRAVHRRHPGRRADGAALRRAGRGRGGERRDRNDRAGRDPARASPPCACPARWRTSSPPLLRPGFDGVELFEPDLVASPLSPAEVRDRCADLGLSIDLYQPFRDLDSTDPDRLAANLRRAERKFDVMERLGADTVLVCSSVGADAVADPDELAAQLHALAERGRRRGLRVAYEALAWGTHVRHLREVLEAVRRADHPALGLCLDSFHILSRGSDPAGIAAIPGEKLFFLQLADAPRLPMDVLQWSRHHRLFPGQGAFDLAAFFAPVLAAGLRRPAVAGGLQRRLPPVRPARGPRSTRCARCSPCASSAGAARRTAPRPGRAGPARAHRARLHRDRR